MNIVHYHKKDIQAYATANCKKMTSLEMAKRLKISESTFYSAIGLMEKKPVFKKTKLQIRGDKRKKYVLANHKKMTTIELAKELKTTKNTIKGIKQTLGIVSGRVIKMEAPEVHLGGFFNVNARWSWL